MELQSWWPGPEFGNHEFTEYFFSFTGLPFALVFSLRNTFKSLRRMAPPKPQDLMILGIGLGSFAAIWILVMILESPISDIKEHNWIASLMFNLLSYSAIFLPGFLVLRYVRQTKFLESGPQPKMLSSFIRLCYYGNQDETIDESISETQKANEEANKVQPEWQRAVHLLGCFFGLQVSYLTGGVLQE